MTAAPLLLVLALAAQDATVRQAVRAVAKTAGENAARPEAERLSGDALTDLYFRAACGSGAPARGVVIGLAHALDETGTLAKFPVLRDALKDIETAEERKARLAALGHPTLRGRGDWLRHFVVAAGLCLLTDEKTAESTGIQKELADAAGLDHGKGTGFSFTDLSANYAGISFAMFLTGDSGEKALVRCAASFRGGDFLPDPPAAADALTTKQFEKEWEGAGSPKFRAECARVRLRVQACKGYQ